MNNKPRFDFAVGGQALIEGVMMRSQNYVAWAVRKVDGTIKIKDFKYNSLAQKFKFFNLPFLRGVVSMFEMMALGIRALNFSADEFIQDEEPGKAKEEQKPMPQWQSTLFLTLNVIFSLGFTIVLFKFIPLQLTEWIFEAIPYDPTTNYVAYNFLDGILKLTIFLAYILLISMFKDIKRVFQYHGAEHMAVFNYEEGTPLTVENSARQSRFHPRCGTSFIIFVFLISIVVYSVIPRDPNFLFHLAKRLALLPVIAGVSFEALKLSGKYASNPIVRLLIQPGLAFQRLTTKQPDDTQLEVAVASLQRTLDRETELQKESK
jgi:uncharacterized protein YqhQ